MSDSFSNGRRGVNVTAFLRNIDAPSSSDELNLDADLALFTNTQFYDYESGQNTDFQPQPAKINTDAPTTASPTDLTSTQGPSLSSPAVPDFLTGLTDFNFPTTDFNFSVPQVSGFPDGLGNLPSATPASAPQVFSQQATPAYSPPATNPRVGDKRKSGDTFGTAAITPEEQSRLAAEEDKRRRNTAASARFRIKKKQREQALEKSAKEMTEKNQALEQRVQQLETECKWLRNLLIEKTGDNMDFGKLFKSLMVEKSSESLEKEAGGSEKKETERSSTRKEREPSVKTETA